MSARGSVKDVRVNSPTSFAARKQRTLQSALILSKAPTAPVMDPKAHDVELRDMLSKERLPVSLGAIRSKVKLCLLKLEKEITQFQQLWLNNAAEDSVDTWTDFIKNCLQRIGHYSGIKDYISFDIILDQVADDEEFVRRQEYTEMRDLCRRAFEFSRVVFEWREKIHNNIKHNLEKYFLTMAEEGELLGLKAVDDYEGARVKYENEIYINTSKFDDLLENLQDHISPFSKYIDHFSKLLHYMNGICEAGLAICEPAKKWIMMDECYVANLTAEINRLQSRKSSMTEELRKANHQHKDIKYRIFQGGHSNDRLELKLRNYQQQQREVFIKTQMTKAFIQQLKTEIENKKNQLNVSIAESRKTISPKGLLALAPITGSFKDDLIALGMQLQSRKHERSKLENENANLAKEISRLILELDKSQKRNVALSGKTGSTQKDVLLVQHEFQYMTDKLDTLVKIRELKTSSDTIKKINYFGQGKFRSGDLKEKLAFACRVAADAIDNDWITLYHQLPFSPHRDYDTRINDIKVVERTSSHWDPCTTTQLAFRSLQKWQRMSSTATIEDLVGTLRRMRHSELATGIERKVKSNKWSETGVKLY